MARMNIRRPTAVASIAILLALAALPSEAMAQDRGRGRWEGNGRGPSAAQSQPRQEWRGNREARPDNGAAQRIQQGQAQRMRAAEAAARRPQNRIASPQQAAPQQRTRIVERRSGWETRGGDRVRRPDTASVDRVRNERARSEARRAPPPQVANGTVAEARRNRPDGDWNRDNNRRDGNWRGNNNYRDARRYEDRDRDGRRDNRWNDGRSDDRRRYDNARVHSPRWDDDRRWSYSNGRYHWNRDWRSDKRYDWHNYRRTYRYIYSPGIYYAPYSSYYYRPLLVGHYLNAPFYRNSYWLSDPWEYRLPPAYGPYRWIRYFDDVLLVNIHTGMVVDVIRNFFW